MSSSPKWLERTSNRILMSLLLSSLLLSSQANAQIPHLIRYQGQAVDSQGIPLEGPYTLTFRLYDAQTAGTKVWEEIQANVVLQGGHFSVLLGQVTPPTTIDWSQPRWLSIQVGQDPELAPRQRITSVPLAIRSEKAETAERLAVPVTTSTITDDANRLVPVGAIILWDGASCPTGFSHVVEYAGKHLVGGATAGIDQGADTVVIPTGGSHSHGVGSYTTQTAGDHAHRLVSSGPLEANTPYRCCQPSTTSAGAHAHTITGSSAVVGDHGHGSIDNRPAGRTILLCKKD